MEIFGVLGWFLRQIKPSIEPFLDANLLCFKTFDYELQIVVKLYRI